MSGKLILTHVFFLASLILQGQKVPIGSWSDRLSYNTGRSVVAGNNKIYASTGSSLLVYSTSHNELSRLSEVNGLSETGISAISFSSGMKCLIISYDNTKLDLVFETSVFNISDILDKYIPLKKRINRISTRESYAYLASGFGIVVVDLEKKEIHDTWQPGPGPEPSEVFDVAFSDNRIFAATETGLWMADLSEQGLAWSGNWTQITGFNNPDRVVSSCIFSGGKLYFVVPDASGDLIYSIADTPELFSALTGEHITSLMKTPLGFLVSTDNSVRLFDINGVPAGRITSFGYSDPYINQCIMTGNDLWLADENKGLVHGVNMTSFTRLNLPGPASNKVSDIISGNGSVLICEGGTNSSWQGSDLEFRASLFRDNKYSIIHEPGSDDAISGCFDPSDVSHYFISSWGNGFFEYKGNMLVKHYDAGNSPLEPGPFPDDGIRISGMAMDDERNLWILQSSNSANVHLLKPDGTLIVNLFTISTPVAGDILASSTGRKWITLPEGNGLFVIDDNNTPGNYSDDLSKKIGVRDEEGTAIDRIFSLAEDHDGNIWAGTDQGPVIYPVNSAIFDPDIRCHRIKVPRNDGSGLADYLLGTESITSLAVDGADRKWLGTKNSGVYLLSSDGQEILTNYNDTNSPLLSDSIAALGVDNTTGEVWIGTSKGIVSVRELATAGNNDYSSVYAFPNPVGADYNGKLTITGLMPDTRLKITDVSGNLVYETMSAGGQAEWDLTSYTGRRVSTGVYIIFCANPDGTFSGSTKVLVIGN